MNERRVSVPEERTDNQCLTCSKASVCKYRDSYMKTYDGLSQMVDFPQPFKIKLECQYYDTGIKIGTCRAGLGINHTAVSYIVNKGENG